MKTTLKVNLIIDDKCESGFIYHSETTTGKETETLGETSHRTLKRLIDSGKFKSEYIPPYLDTREPIIIITEL